MAAGIGKVRGLRDVNSVFGDARDYRWFIVRNVPMRDASGKVDELGRFGD